MQTKNEFNFQGGTLIKALCSSVRSYSFRWSLGRSSNLHFCLPKVIFENMNGMSPSLVCLTIALLICNEVPCDGQSHHKIGGTTHQEILDRLRIVEIENGQQDRKINELSKMVDRLGALNRELQKEFQTLETKSSEPSQLGRKTKNLYHPHTMQEY